MLRTRQISYIFEELGDFTKRKGWFNFCCPYHKGEEHHFGVNLRDGGFCCWVCGQTGNLHQLHRDLKKGYAEGLRRSKPLRIGRRSTGGRDDVPYALFKRLNEDQQKTVYGGASQASGPGGRPRGPECEDDTSSGLLKRLNGSGLSHTGRNALDRWFRDHYTSLEDAGGGVLARKAFNYLNKRGVDYKRVMVGFLDGCDGRLVFPFQMGGTIVYYQGRALYNMPLKTINPDEGAGWLPKTRILYNHDELLMCEKEIALTEGIFDAYSVGETLGIPYTCLLGSTISDAQVRLLKACDVKKILVFLDAEANSQAVKVGVKLWENKFKVRVVVWPKVYQDKKLDPNDISPTLLRLLVKRYAVPLDHTASSQLLLLYG